MVVDYTAIYLYQGFYQGKTDEEYNSTQFYKIWIKQSSQLIIIKKQDGTARRMYGSLISFFAEWGLVQMDCHLIKL